MEELNHPDHYSLNEGARRTVLLVRSGWRFTRGKSTAKVDRALQRLADEATAREAAARAAKKK